MSAGWDALNAAMASAEAEVAAAAPDAATAAEGAAYVVRALTACLSDAFLGHLLTEGGLARVLPTRGGPNPDYLMRLVPIDPTRRYRIEGRLNQSERVGIGLYTFDSGGAALLAGYAAFDPATAAADGSFVLDLAADAAGPGALAIPPGCRILIVRILHRNTRGRPATVGMTEGASPAGLSVATGTADGGLAQAAHITLSGIRQFLEWSRVTSASPNRFITPPPSIAATVKGDPDTLYYLGYYQLADGAWLEALMPPDLAGYWSVHAYNHWLESLPGAGIHDLGAIPDPDGRIRLRIGPAVPPDLPNRIDTHGRSRGVLICRIIGTQDAGLPETRVLSEQR